MFVESILLVVLFVLFCDNVVVANKPIRRLRRHEFSSTTAQQPPRALQTVEQRQTTTITYMRKPCLTSSSCQERYTALYNAGTITGYYYNIPSTPNTSSKGCILKGENVIFTNGTDDEMMAT